MSQPKYLQILLDDYVGFLPLLFLFLFLLLFLLLRIRRAARGRDEVWQPAPLPVVQDNLGDYDGVRKKEISFAWKTGKPSSLSPVFKSGSPPFKSFPILFAICVRKSASSSHDVSLYRAHKYSFFTRRRTSLMWSVGLGRFSTRVTPSRKNGKGSATEICMRCV